jgi:hypothetical protein
MAEEIEDFMGMIVAEKGGMGWMDEEQSYGRNGRDGRRQKPGKKKSEGA